jgi:hypothetical protein
MPISRSRGGSGIRPISAALIVAVVTLGTGCAGTPRIGDGSLADAKTRVTRLVRATGRALGPRAPVISVPAADELPCKKRFLGYAVGDTGAHQAELPVIVPLTGAVDGASLLPRVESFWRSRGYKIDRSGMSDHTFPKLRTRVGDTLLVATGYVNLPEVNLYAVSPCVRD